MLLAFDTSGPWCAVALQVGQSDVITQVAPMKKGQAEQLFPMAQQLLANARVEFAELNAIGVGVGPGNFTGIRVAVSAARGLALGLNVPAIGITSFDASANGQDIAAYVEAPRGQAYIKLPGKEPYLAKQDDATTLGAAPLPSPEDLVIRIAALAYKRLNEPEQQVHPKPVPLYIRPADAAPPRDAPPKILDDA